MLGLALVTAVRGGPSDRGPIRSAPSLAIVAPVDGDTVDAPVPVVFGATARLEVTESGWGTDSLHLHLGVDGRDVMPARHEIVATADGHYRWSFAGLEPGPHTLRLFWSDASHRPLAAGASPAVTVTVR